MTISAAVSPGRWMASATDGANTLNQRPSEDWRVTDNPDTVAGLPKSRVPSNATCSGIEGGAVRGGPSEGTKATGPVSKSGATSEAVPTAVRAFTGPCRPIRVATSTPVGGDHGSHSATRDGGNRSATTDTESSRIPSSDNSTVPSAVRLPPPTSAITRSRTTSVPAPIESMTRPEKVPESIRGSSQAISAKALGRSVERSIPIIHSPPGPVGPAETSPDREDEGR